MDELTAEVTAILASREPGQAYHWLHDRGPALFAALAAITAERDQLRAAAQAVIALGRRHYESEYNAIYDDDLPEALQALIAVVEGPPT